MMTTLKQPVRTALWIVLAVFLFTACGNDTSENEKKHYTVAIYNAIPGVFDEIGDNVVARMAEMGYTEGENMTYIHASTGDELTAALEAGVDVVVSSPGRMAYISGAAVDDTPLVFVPSGDPVGQGLVETISKPGGTATGIWQTDAVEKRFQLLHDLVPDVKTFYATYDSTDPAAVGQLNSVEELAASLGITLIAADVPSANQDANQRALDNIPDEAGAIFMVGNNAAGLANGWPEAAIRHKMPLSAVGTATVNTDYGPLMSYGPDMASMGRQAANLVHQILQGTPPGELPVETAEFFLTFDLRLADLIGLEVPDTILRQAATIYRVDTDGELPPLPEEAPETAPMFDVPSGACTVTMTSPGGSNSVCLTLTCGELPQGTMVTFSDPDPVAGCTDENLAGTCSTPEYDLLFYDGDPAILEIGCSFMEGTWTPAGE